MRGWDWAVNSVLFTVYHLAQPWTWLGILPDALVATYVTKRARSVWPAVMGHFVANAIGIISVWVLG